LYFINISGEGCTIELRANKDKFFDASVDISDQTYVIRDPFNSTYNPAKTLKGIENPTFKLWCKQALSKLKTNGILLEEF